MLDLQYINDKKGNLKAVVIPVRLWKRLLPDGVYDENELSDAIEDYCMNKAMDDAKKTPLLTKDEALAHLKPRQGMWKSCEFFTAANFINIFLRPLIGHSSSYLLCLSIKKNRVYRNE